MALIGLYYLVSGACLQGAGNLADTLSGIMTATAGAALVGAVLFFGGSLDLSRVCKSPVAMLCCALLLIPFAGAAANPLAAACTALSAAVFELVVFLMMCDLCRRRNLPAVFVFGIEESLTVLRPLGAFLAGVAAQANLPLALVEATAVGILAVATLVLFNRADLQGRWGIAVLDRGGLSEGRDAKERLVASCERLCDEAGLTPREREALGYLAQGLTVAELAQAMGVAKGTAKAHCEHVYAKLGIPRARGARADARRRGGRVGPVTLAEKPRGPRSAPRVSPPKRVWPGRTSRVHATARPAARAPPRCPRCSPR